MLRARTGKGSYCQNEETTWNMEAPDVCWTAFETYTYYLSAVFTLEWFPKL
jgi:hypothetical protein